nr:MAG TPA: hypothetical protein [Bacteriophage sp.]
MSVNLYFGILNSCALKHTTLIRAININNTFFILI